MQNKSEPKRTKANTQMETLQKEGNFAITEVVAGICKHFKFTPNTYNNALLRLGKEFIAGLNLPDGLMEEGSEFAKLVWRFWAKDFYTRSSVVLMMIEEPQLQEKGFSKYRVFYDLHTVHLIQNGLKTQFYAQFKDQISAFFTNQNKPQNATKKESTAKPKKRNITVSKS